MLTRAQPRSEVKSRSCSLSIRTPATPGRSGSARRYVLVAQSRTSTRSPPVWATYRRDAPPARGRNTSAWSNPARLPGGIGTKPARTSAMAPSVAGAPSVAEVAPQPSVGSLDDRDVHEEADQAEEQTPAPGALEGRPMPTQRPGGPVHQRGEQRRGKAQQVVRTHGWQEVVVERRDVGEEPQRERGQPHEHRHGNVIALA